MANGRRIYHITTQDAWLAAQLQGEYRAASLDTEGFIHCSTAKQVWPVANTFYRHQPNLVLLHIDPARLGPDADLREEPPAHPASTTIVPATAPGELFPHLYGPLPVVAVVDVSPLTPTPDGTFTPTALG